MAEVFRGISAFTNAFNNGLSGSFTTDSKKFLLAVDSLLGRLFYFLGPVSVGVFFTFIACFFGAVLSPLLLLFITGVPLIIVSSILHSYCLYCSQLHKLPASVSVSKSFDSNTCSNLDFFDSIGNGDDRFLLSLCLLVGGVLNMITMCWFSMGVLYANKFRSFCK